MSEFDGGTVHYGPPTGHGGTSVHTGRREDCLSPDCYLEQPEPIPNAAVSIQSLVRDDLIQREQLGISRYGTPLQAFNGRDALRDAYEEALDLACYLRQAIEERRGAAPGEVPRTSPGAAPEQAKEVMGGPPVGPLRMIRTPGGSWALGRSEEPTGEVPRTSPGAAPEQGEQP